MPSESLLDRLPEMMRLASVPAVSIGVVEAGEVTFARGFGVRHAENGGPADENTVFEAASLSKPPVAFVAMLLRDEGAFDIDRPLVDYVGPSHQIADPRVNRITARHVMSQSSGFRNWRRPNDTEFDLSFDPGTEYQYSGEGFVWLARALERVTGVGFAQLMRERLFDPLGLDSTTYLWSPDVADRMATGHNARGEPTQNGMHLRMAQAHHEIAAARGENAESWNWGALKAAVQEEDPSHPGMPGGMIPNAAASLLTTATEYARFTAQALDSPPAASARLSPESLALMRTPQTQVEAPLTWGLGFALEDQADTRYLWHWGNNGDFHSYVMADTVGQRVITVLANAGGGPKVYRRIVRDVVGFDPAALIWIL